MTRIAIVGGGIAGLSIAHALLQRGASEPGIDLVVLERAGRAGGNIRTDVIDGFVCEWGPNGFLDNVPATLDLVRDLGLQDRLQPSDERARKRYIFRRGMLHALPGGPLDFLKSGLLSWPGKVRIALEPAARRRPAGDETIHAFATRRIGREAADILIDPMVSGVFGGDARRLSLKACFPKMWEIETEHGSLFRALLARSRRRRRRGEPVGSPLGRLTSFVGGSEDLIRALVARLGASLRTGTEVRQVRANGSRYDVEIENAPSFQADAVVLAAGASASAGLIRPLDAALADTLDAIPTVPMVVVCLGYAEHKLPRPLDGFGFLVPRGEGPRLLGVLWDSSVYPGRAPKGCALVRAMLGGAHDPDAIALEDRTLLEITRHDLEKTMQVRLEPDFVRVFRHPIGIPQYTVGHIDRLARAESRLAAHPGLFLAGNAYRGVAINACVAEAPAIAARVLAHALRRPGMLAQAGM
ncbi:MAG: protoporphyrinogen oxidase [Vicinamibacterales bacterium]